MSSDREVALEVRELSIHYGGTVAVDALNLSVRRGGITGLIGPNGAGKTTTFNACSGLLTPTTGNVLLDGNDVTGLSPQQRAQLGMGRTFQRMELFASLDVRQNVALGREARMSGKQPWRHLFCSSSERQVVDVVTDEALELCAITHLANQPVMSLSTGQRRLVELARAVAGGFRLLLLDEPSSGLDVSETDVFRDILLSLVVEMDAAILLVEHDMSLVMSACERVYVIDFGRLIFEGDTGAAQRSHAVRAAYLGEAS